MSRLTINFIFALKNSASFKTQLIDFFSFSNFTDFHAFFNRVIS